MSTKSSLTLAMIMLTAVLLPFAAIPAAASSEIDVALSSSHEQMVPGMATNVSVSVTNDNVMSTRSFDLTLDTTYLPSHWNVTLADSSLGPVFPTQTDSTTLIIRLDPNAPLGGNGQVDVTATRTDDANESTTVTLQLSVEPLYLPTIDSAAVGDSGLFSLHQNETIDVDIPVINNGNVEDTIILQVDEADDIAAFWANWNSSNSNNSGNNTGGNNGTGNNTGGNNGTGNNTGGNSSNGTSMKNSARNIPNDWEVRWLDPVAVNMTAGESRLHTMRISVPSDATPQYLGVALFASSLGGNFSIQTTIMIEVVAESDAVISVVHDANRTYLPGQTEVVVVDITNSGNDETSFIYSTSSDASCDVSMTQTTGSDLLPLASEQITMNVTPVQSSNWNDTCSIIISAEDTNSGETHSVSYSIVIGVDWGWELTPPASVTISPGETETIQVSVRNVGSELDEVMFSLAGPSGVSASGPPSWMSIDRGLSDVVSFQVGLSSETSLVGAHNLTLTATGMHGGEQEVVSVTLMVTPRTELNLESPQGGNVLVSAGAHSNFSISASNLGTAPIAFTIDWSGLPSTLSLTVPESETIEAGEIMMLPMAVSAQGSASAATHQVTIFAKTSTGEVLSQTLFTIEVAHSPGVQILSSSDSFPVSDSATSSFEFVILNDGNQGDQFTFSIEPSTDGFDVMINPLLMTLDAGGQDTVSVTMRRTTAVGEVALSFVATSANDEAVSDSFSFTATEVTRGVTTAVTSSSTSAAVGELIQSYLWVTNTGNSNETFQVSTSGLDCPTVQSTLTISPSASATPVLLDCTVAEHTLAGITTLSTTVTSLADPSVTSTAILNFTVPTDRENGQPKLAVQVTGSGDNVLPYQGSLVLTVSLVNNGNEQLSGLLSLVGEGAADMSPGWTAVGGSSNPNYELSPGDSVTYELLLVSSIATAGGEMSMRVQAAGSGHQLLSNEFTVDVASPAVAPSGISLGFIEMDNQMSITIMAVGWLITILLVVLGRSSAKRRKNDHIRSTFYETEEELPLPLPPAPVVAAIDMPTPTLSNGEAKMIDGRVTCTGCAASLKMPSDKTPPYKFKCPKCEESVRVVE